MANAEEQDALLIALFQELEACPDSSTPSAVPLVSSNDTPAHREKLAVLVSTGKSKEAIGVQLTHVLARLSGSMMRKNCRKNSKMTTSLAVSCHPLLANLHCDVGPC